MKNIQLLLLCLFANTLFAQEVHNIKYGKVSEEELKMNYFTSDSSADAVLIHEEGNIEFGYDKLSGVKIIFSYFGRYKILKKSGLDRGIIKIPLYKGSYDEREMLRSVDGCTYNLENGKIVSTKLGKDGIFHEHVVDKKFQEKLSMPHLKEGSVFEYRYIKETPFVIRDKPATWFFQGNIPVQWSELNVVLPSYFVYRILKGGYLPILDESGKTFVKVAEDLETNAVTHHYVVKNAPSFHNEAYISTELDYISKIDFELTSVMLPDRFTKNYTETWESLSKTLLKTDHYEETFRRTGFLAPVIETIKSEKDTLKRIQLAFEYISKNLQWNELVSVYAHHDASQVFSNKKGSATELNLMLIALLKSVGVNANPVALSTRDNGSINELFPSLDQFNYTIACAQVNGKDMLMDATDPLTKPGMLPKRCLNNIGRLIGENSRFVSLTPTEKDAHFEMMTISLNPATNEFTGNTIITEGGYAAHKIREILKEDGEANLLKNLKKQNAEWEIKNFKLENKDNVSEALKVSYEFSFAEGNPATTIYFSPMFSCRVTNNPFTEQKRIYPVDLTVASDQTFMATIKVPAGYAVEETPKPATVSLPDNLGKFSYLVAVAGDAVKITSRILLNEFYFAPEEYEQLKAFYELIVQKHAEQIVLKKK